MLNSDILKAARRDSDFNPTDHYLDRGIKEGREIAVEASDGSGKYVGVWNDKCYLESYKDVARSTSYGPGRGSLHYKENGYKEGRLLCITVRRRWDP